MSQVRILPGAPLPGAPNGGHLDAHTPTGTTGSGRLDARGEQSHREPRMSHPRRCGREPRRRRPQPPPPAGPRRDGPRLRGAPRRGRGGPGGAPLRGALQPQLPGNVRRDAPPLPAAAPGGALDVPPAGVGPQRHRGLHGRRVHEPGELQLGVSRHRRRDALGVPGRARPDGGSELLPDGDDAPVPSRPPGRRPAHPPQRRRAIEQFRRSAGRGRPGESHPYRQARRRPRGRTT